MTVVTSLTRRRDWRISAVSLKVKGTGGRKSAAQTVVATLVCEAVRSYVRQVRCYQERKDQIPYVVSPILLRSCMACLPE